MAEFSSLTLGEGDRPVIVRRRDIVAALLLRDAPGSKLFLLSGASITVREDQREIFAKGLLSKTTDLSEAAVDGVPAGQGQFAYAAEYISAVVGDGPDATRIYMRGNHSFRLSLSFERWADVETGTFGRELD